MMPETHTAQIDPLPLDQHAESEAEEKDKVPKGDPLEETVTTVEPEPVVARGDDENTNPGD